MNPLGEIVYSKTGNGMDEQTIDTPLSPGIYFTQVLTANGSATGKLVIE